MRKPMRHLVTALAAALLGALALAALPAGAAGKAGDGGEADAAKAAPGKSEGKPEEKKGEGDELKPFDKVVKGATESKGYFTLWQKDDKVWIEIPEDRLDKPFFFEANVSDSLGERGLYGSQMGDSHMAVFRRIGNTVLLVARNAAHRAGAGSPAELAVGQSFSDSLIATAPVVSRRDGEHGPMLVDANKLLLRDILGYTTDLEASFRLTYAMDGAASGFTSARTDAEETVFKVSASFSTPRLPGFISPENKHPPAPPREVPDPRSFFVGFVYSFAPLPAEPMQPRVADDRVGYFQSDIADYSGDSGPSARLHFIHRWRLEKKDPEAAMSEPKEPIVFWIDRNVPKDYRPAIADGILEWNKAFERIGFKDAIVVKIQPDDAEFDTLDARHASVRWFVGADVGFAIGPSRVDPRTGEILDADIGLSDAFTRQARQLVSEELPPRPGTQQPFRRSRDACTYQAGAADELGFGAELLAARDGLAADGPEAERLVKAYLKDVVSHEVGHTLGLRHNFHASTIHTLAQTDDAAFTREHGLAGSVMDYIPINIALPGQPQGEYVMSTLGPYDYWAIEYGYRPLEPAQEAAGLAKIASRSAEPDLAFATDEDAGFGPGAEGADPQISRFDLGADPLEYLKRRLALSRELWDRMQSRAMQPGENYLVLRRNLERGFRQVARAAPLVAKYVGGERTTRDHAGTGRALAEPVDAAAQKQALTVLAQEIFSEKSFGFKPAFIGRLGIDYLDREQFAATNGAEFDLGGRVLKLQAETLDQVLSDDVAGRLVGAGYYTDKPRELLTLAQVYDTLQAAIWSELDAHRDIPPMRRGLQREYLKHLTAAILKPSSGPLADVHSLARADAIALRERVQKALVARPGPAAAALSVEARAHLQQTVATIDEALKATPVKAGP